MGQAFMHSPQRMHISRNILSGIEPGGRISLSGDTFETASILRLKAERAPAPAERKSPLLVRLTCGSVLYKVVNVALKDIAD